MCIISLRFRESNNTNFGFIKNSFYLSFATEENKSLQNVRTPNSKIKLFIVLS